MPFREERSSRVTSLSRQERMGFSVPGVAFAGSTGSLSMV